MTEPTFTSEDVEASYNRIINPPEGLVSHRQATFGVVSSINVKDDYTIAFELSEPRAEAFMMQGFASGWNIIHQRETLDANNGDLKQADDAPGTGPFRYVRQDVGKLVPGEESRLLESQYAVRQR